MNTYELRVDKEGKEKMNFFWVWNGRRLKKYMIIAIAAFFTAGILYVDQTQVPVFTSGEKPVAIYKVDSKEKQVALTFNISWGENKVMPILDILKEHEINNATFFISASWAERHPDIVERIVEDGHEIGSHGFQHKHYTEWEDEQIRKDIQTAHRIIQEVSGIVPKYLRPPNGTFDERVLKIAKEQNYDIIHWSINTNDWKNPGVDTIVHTVTKNVSNGDIILMHASDSVKQTEKALPLIIKNLKDNGYTFRSVSELLSGATVKPKEIN